MLHSFSPAATHNLAFVFMVGDGILNATLKSPVPLNDNEWHFVQAEINVKLARIKVDYQPWAVHRFPGQTFVTMKFTHPLLVGRRRDISDLKRPRLQFICTFGEVKKITPEDNLFQVRPTGH